jgi:hypothetical protein
MTNTTTIKAKLAAIAAAEGVSDLVADDMSSRFVWIGMDEGDQSEEVIKIYGRSEAETARIQKFIASSRTLLPGMAELWLEEIEWLEGERCQACDGSGWRNHGGGGEGEENLELCPLAERLEGLLR